MSRDIVLGVLVAAFALLEIWGHRADQRIEAWARGDA